MGKIPSRDKNLKYHYNRFHKLEFVKKNFFQSLMCAGHYAEELEIKIIQNHTTCP